MYRRLEKYQLNKGNMEKLNILNNSQKSDEMNKMGWSTKFIGKRKVVTLVLLKKNHLSTVSIPYNNDGKKKC